MKRRTASDRMAECIIELVHEYKKEIKILNDRISSIHSDNVFLRTELSSEIKKREKAVDQTNKATDIIGEVSDIIASVTAHHEGGDISIYLSNIPDQGDRKRKMERLFELLDIPMTEAEIKEGDTIDED